MQEKEKAYRLERKLALFINDMPTYLENPKRSSKKMHAHKKNLLELKIKYSKVAVYEINIQK